MNDQRTLPRLCPPVSLGLGVVLMVALHYVVPLAPWLGWPWRAVGALPIAAGVLGGVTAAAQFRRHDTTIIPFERSRALITEGPFRYSRNPVYLSMVLILVGVWLLLGSLSPLLVVPAFLWWISTRFIAREERDLAEQFGSAYRAYQDSVRRWI